MTVVLKRNRKCARAFDAIDALFYNCNVGRLNKKDIETDSDGCQAQVQNEYFRIVFGSDNKISCSSIHDYFAYNAALTARAEGESG
ncbi:hypothetical protein A3742_14520 [Oleiphilus sp. HI0071]|nr:hypothetical protein A3737_24900 [Oleiphilus sp. HI0065]KZY79268.1 hypothetical protein A3742_14520 [Oleiphilus sp. HI0071]KZY89974.1 hypothetical protein A3744_22300 [Oleiphilus sp. HI0073]KZZ18215.1 hypothetical protein A3751_09050 [Oleiphilus sp. HI0080]KZZ48507.1 hypothetical protein A3760_15415 [Oleiphilus sp. HI0122]